MQQTHQRPILVTGANGLLGQTLVPLLIARGHSVVATGRGPDRLRQDGYRYEDVELTDAQAVAELLARHRPAVVIHAAAMSQVDDCERNRDRAWAVNVASTEALLQAARALGAFFLYVSTDFVFWGDKPLLAEEDTPNPPNYYGETKLASEQLVMQPGLPWAVARTVLVYGHVRDMSRSNLLLWVRDSLQAGRPIRVVQDQFRTPTWVGDLALGCALIAEQQAQGIFHLSGKDYLSPYQMALQAAQLLGLDQSLISPVDAATFQEMGRRPLLTGFAIGKARKVLGYEPHTFQEGMRMLFGLS